MRIILKIVGSNTPNYYPNEIYLGDTQDGYSSSSGQRNPIPVPAMDWLINKNGIQYMVIAYPVLDIEKFQITIGVEMVTIEPLTKMIYLYKQSLNIVGINFKYEIESNVNSVIKERFSQFCNSIDSKFQLEGDWEFRLRKIASEKN